jgi:bacterioferritin-associated ferredoxin
MTLVDIDFQYHDVNFNEVSAAILNAGSISRPIPAGRLGSPVMLVCHCRRVFDREIRTAIRDGACTVDDVGAACAAGVGCGGCQEAIEDLIDAELNGHASLGRLPPITIEQHGAEFHLPVARAAS